MDQKYETKSEWLQELWESAMWLEKQLINQDKFIQSQSHTTTVNSIKTEYQKHAVPCNVDDSYSCRATTLNGFTSAMLSIYHKQIIHKFKLQIPGNTDDQSCNFVKLLWVILSGLS